MYSKKKRLEFQGVFFCCIQEFIPHMKVNILNILLRNFNF